MVNKLDRIDEITIFSDPQNLLAYRKQVQDIQMVHMNTAVDIQKYFTTLISALFTLNVTLIVAVIANYSEESIKIFRAYPVLYLIFTVIPLLTIFISYVAINTNYREYRNSTEHLTVKMKIDALLNLYNKKTYDEYKHKLNNEEIKIFPCDESFATWRWKNDLKAKTPKYSGTTSKDFIDKLIRERKAHVYTNYNHIFVAFLFLGIFSVVSIVIFACIKHFEITPSDPVFICLILLFEIIVSILISLGLYKFAQYNLWEWLKSHLCKKDDKDKL